MPTLTDALPDLNAGGPIPTLSANQLRYLAEKADGMRAKALALVIDGNAVDVVPADDKEIGRTKTKLLDLNTPTRGDGVAGDAKIEIHWNGKSYGGPNTILNGADAVFVTQSAIEKFLLPYYMRFKSGAQVQALENSLFNNKNVAAAIHIPPSITLKFPGQAITSELGKDACEIAQVAIVCTDRNSGELTSALVPTSE